MNNGYNVYKYVKERKNDTVSLITEIVNKMNPTDNGFDSDLGYCTVTKRDGKYYLLVRGGNEVAKTFDDLLAVTAEILIRHW